MSSKLVTIIIAVVVLVGGGAFYGGMKYAESNPPAGGRGGFSRGDFSVRGGSAFGGQNLSPEERQQRLQELGVDLNGTFNQDHDGFRRGFTSGNNGSRSMSGEIISQSEGSFTIKLNDGSTKIVFVNDTTQITKFVDGTLDDFNAGEQIFVSGDENPDGSWTAKTIQLSPFAR